MPMNQGHRLAARLSLLLPFVAAAPACGDDAGTTVDEAAASEVTLIDGTPEAVGVLALLADAATTFELLDGPVGLDARAARGSSPFATAKMACAAPPTTRPSCASARSTRCPTSGRSPSRAW